MKRAALLAGVVLVAGCGGDDGLSRRQIADRANVICAKYSDEAKKLGKPDLRDWKVALDFFSRATELARDQQKELEALRPAPAVKADYARLTKATGEATALFAQLEAAARERDAARRDELINRLTPLATEGVKAANAVGAATCGNAA